MALRNTINQIQAQDRAQRQIRSNAGAFIGAWYKDLHALFSSIRTFLGEYEQDESMSFQEEEINVEEDALGRYNVPVLKISVADVVVRAIPVARVTAASTGRVDLVRDDRSSAADHVRMIRAAGPGGEPGAWEIYQPGTLSRFVGSEFKVTYVPLSKSSFEGALDYLLRL